MNLDIMVRNLIGNLMDISGRYAELKTKYDNRGLNDNELQKLGEAEQEMLEYEGALDVIEEEVRKQLGDVELLEACAILRARQQKTGEVK